MNTSMRRLMFAVLFTLAVSPAHTVAATLPAGFTEALVAGGLTNPMSMAFAPDGRLFVCLQGGQVRIIKEGTLLPSPFLTLAVDASGEGGLLAIAFDPNFAVNHYVYVYYTATAPTIHNRVSRFTANGDVVVAGSEVIVFELDSLTTGFHMGGGMQFGADGKLYISAGDNESPGSTRKNSQTLGNFFGKLLRINGDGTIPTDNPFVQQVTGKNGAIWALGLRNPFTVAIHARSGRMFINDVGENTYEEVNEARAGANYGWALSEGATANPDQQGPLYFYGHGSGLFTGCAITGGAFYHPLTRQFPEQYLDKYFFADYCAGWINAVDPGTGGVTTFASGLVSPVGVQVAEGGALYYLVRGSQPTAGAVYRVDYSGSQAPSITQHPVSQIVPVGQPVTFTVSASGTPPLTYQWQRNGGDVTGATNSAYSISSVSTGDSGAAFRCVVSNAAGSAISNAATLTVTGNSPPVATITQPAAGALYSGGTTITYAATGTDAEDGTLPAAAFTWYVDFHHEDHTHPVTPPASGSTSGSFTIPSSGETSTNVWYRIHLRVIDSKGLESSTFRDVRPRIVTVKLATQRSGLQVTVDGQVSTAPFTFSAVAGTTRTIGTTTPQTIGGGGYVFESWSDSGPATHTIVVPEVASTYTARFRKQ